MNNGGNIYQSRTKGVLILSRPLKNKKALSLEDQGFGGTKMQNITLDTISVSSFMQAFDMFTRLRDILSARKAEERDARSAQYKRLLRHAFYRCPKKNLQVMHKSLCESVESDESLWPSYRSFLIGMVFGRNPRLARKLEGEIV